MKGLEPPSLAAQGPKPCAPALPKPVPRRGLEPPSLAAHGPKPCVSTISPPWQIGEAGLPFRHIRFPAYYTVFTRLAKE